MCRNNKKLFIDRIEENVVIAFDDNNVKYTFRLNDNSLCESDIILAKITKSGELESIKVLKEETSLKKSSIFFRLQRLFKKKG